MTKHDLIQIATIYLPLTGALVIGIVFLAIALGTRKDQK